MKKIVLFLPFILTCCSVNKAQDEVSGSSWLNLKYVECIKNKLPCECEKEIDTDYSFISIYVAKDSLNHIIAFNKYGQLEPYVYYIREIKQNEYAVLKSDTDSICATFLIKDDTLIFKKNNSQSQFIKSELTKKYDNQFYVKDNVYLLNKALLAHGYPNLEQLVHINNDSLYCDCNFWLGAINLLSVKGQSKHWVLEINNDSLYIKKVIEDDDASPDDSIITEKIYSFKWNEVHD